MLQVLSTSVHETRLTYYSTFLVEPRAPGFWVGTRLVSQSRYVLFVHCTTFEGYSDENDLDFPGTSSYVPMRGVAIPLLTRTRFCSLEMSHPLLEDHVSRYKCYTKAGDHFPPLHSWGVGAYFRRVVSLVCLVCPS